MAKNSIEILFSDGDRKDAIAQAIALIKQNGRSAKVIVCRDIPGEHSGGEDCFCDPKVLNVYPEDLK